MTLGKKITELFHHMANFNNFMIRRRNLLQPLKSFLKNLRWYANFFWRAFDLQNQGYQLEPYWILKVNYHSNVLSWVLYVPRQNGAIFFHSVHVRIIPSWEIWWNNSTRQAHMFQLFFLNALVSCVKYTNLNEYALLRLFSHNPI